MFDFYCFICYHIFMKKILIVFITLLILVGCSQNNEIQKVVDEDPLIMHANAKDHAEFFLVKQGTPVNEFNPKDIIEVELNKDISYEIEWVGERYANQCDNYSDVVRILGEKAENDIEQSKIDTLNFESFRPITIYIIGKYNENIYEQCVNTLLLVVPEKLYDDLSEMPLKRVEDAYREINKLGSEKYGPYKFDDKYHSQIYGSSEIYKNANKAIREGKPIEEWSVGTRTEDILFEFGYMSNISDNYDY